MAMSMSTLSGKKIYPQRPHTEHSPGEPPPCLLQWPQWTYIESTKFSTHLLEIQRGRRRRSTGDLTHKTGKVRLSSGRCSPNNCYRRTSTAVSPLRSNGGISKRREHSSKQTIPLQLRTRVKENPNTQAPNSLPSSSERASGSSYEQCTATSTSLSNPNANEEIAVHVSVGKNDDGLSLTNEAPSSEQRPKEPEGDNAVESHEDSECLGSSTHPDTEHHANLVAASDECRHLYQEYYERTHDDSVIEEDNRTDAYWKWDRKKHQWFHKDPETQSIVWFMG
ncbi:hypothetical protein F5Y09DRAFT_342125 [Xylaria sp. FL1042]|nr:hypothetical protein F5Y09DRAFT_342125 [Xylaria sp. FL1042]